MGQEIPAQANVDSVTIAKYLSAIEHHELIPKATILALVPNRLLFGKHAWVLSRAVLITQRDSGKYFAHVRGQGLRRLTAGEFHTVGSDATRRINKMARRTIRKMLVRDADPDKMTNEERIKFHAQFSSHGVLAMATSRRSMATLEAATEAAKRRLTAEESIKSGLRQIESNGSNEKTG